MAQKTYAEGEEMAEERITWWVIPVVLLPVFFFLGWISKGYMDVQSFTGSQYGIGGGPPQPYLYYSGAITPSTSGPTGASSTTGPTGIMGTTGGGILPKTTY